MALIALTLDSLLVISCLAVGLDMIWYPVFIKKDCGEFVPHIVDSKKSSTENEARETQALR